MEARFTGVVVEGSSSPSIEGKSKSSSFDFTGVDSFDFDVDGRGGGTFDGLEYDCASVLLLLCAVNCCCLAAEDSDDVDAVARPLLGTGGDR